MFPSSHCFASFALSMCLFTFISVFFSSAHARRPGFFPLAKSPSAFISSLLEEEEVIVSDGSSEPTDTIVAVPGPVISDVQNEIISSTHRNRRGEGNYRLLGTFTITNASLDPFILQLTFADGGVLKHGDDKVAAVVRLRNLHLRYLDTYNRVVTKRLSREDYRGDGYLYEVMFLPEDVQELYELELWGFPDSRESSAAGRRGAGLYSTEVGLHIEPLTYEVESKPSVLQRRRRR